MYSELIMTVVRHLSVWNIPTIFPYFGQKWASASNGQICLKPTPGGGWVHRFG